MDGLDRLIVGFDKALRTVMGPAHSVRPHPGGHIHGEELGEQDKRHAAALMRVNHAGEVCAQALYQGQALMSSDASVTAALEQAANEETEHLAWTAQRIQELGGRTSLLNPVWYLGALTMGMVAGRLGDRWNLGFLAETERQVERHLQDHLERLPAADGKSREILQQMKIDEVRHADTAVGLGAHALPQPVKMLMTVASRVMTRTAYYV